jgi:hypothetical protein
MICTGRDGSRHEDGGEDFGFGGDGRPEDAQMVSTENRTRNVADSSQACPRSANRRLPQMSIQSKTGSKTTFDY